MVAVKKKRKKKRSKQPKKGGKGLFFTAFVGFFVVLSGVFIFLVFSSEDVMFSNNTGDIARNEPPISYEETSVLSDPVIIESEGKKSRVVETSPKDLVVGNDRPLVAIVIDDMGYNKKTCEALLYLDLDLSFAFLPFGPHTVEQAYTANQLGRNVLLHFPMEAADAKWKPGPGTVTIAMDSSEIQRIFAKNLTSVPYAVGINNHMGSRFTQNNRGMKEFMASVKETGLFFLDSRTSRNTVGSSLAKKMAVRTAERDVFLDNVRDSQKIIIQLRKLLDVARRQGSAIAIGHPYPETLQALKEYRREILRQAEVVGVGSLVR